MRIIDGSINLIDNLVAGIRPGDLCREVNERGTTWMRENGFSDLLVGPTDAPDDYILHFQMWPYFGHGLGLGMEAPWLTRESEVVIKANMVLAIEICLNSPTGELACFEQNIVVRDGEEPENLTRGLRARWWE
jgi:Xaa-Pro aminopeptidase